MAFGACPQMQVSQRMLDTAQVVENVLARLQAIPLEKESLQMTTPQSRETIDALNLVM